MGYFGVVLRNLKFTHRTPEHRGGSQAPGPGAQILAPDLNLGVQIPGSANDLGPSTDRWRRRRSPGASDGTENRPARNFLIAAPGCARVRAKLLEDRPDMDPVKQGWKKDPQMDVGIVVGRFQVESLHEGHRFVIGKALENHRTVIVFIGVPALTEATRHYPLDYPTRVRMLQAEFPDVTLLPLQDRRTDELWSQDLDRKVREVVPNVSRAVIYGGRDSAQGHYRGAFSAVEIDGGLDYRSGSQQRQDIGKVTRNDPNFRAGNIYALMNSRPHVRTAVDIACLRVVENEKVEIALIRKTHEGGKWRLPGGMVDKGETLENAAARELREETKLSVELKSLQYIGNTPSSDWRFKDVGEIGLITTVWGTWLPWGALQAGDDADEAQWFDIREVAEDARFLIRSHQPLLQMVKGFVDRETNAGKNDQEPTLTSEVSR